MMQESSFPPVYKSAESYAKMQAFYDKSLEALPIPVDSQYVETRFGQTHMLVAGDPAAAPLILVQGMAGSAILWHHQIEEFAARHRVYALDTVGQPGRSAPNPPSVTDDSYAMWLLDVINGLGLEQANVAGISIGGWAIFRLGILHPERIRKAVLLSPLRLARAKMNGSRWVGNAMKPDTEDDQLEDRLTARDFASSSGREQYDQRLARAMALATRHYRLGVAMGLSPEASRLQKVMTGWRVLAKFSTSTPERELAAYPVPTLVVMGENEALYDPQKAAARARLMPNAEVVIVPDAGHAAVFDRPEYINQIILDFLAAPLPGEG